jgi:hypothetical protein
MKTLRFELKDRPEEKPDENGVILISSRLAKRISH